MSREVPEWVGRDDNTPIPPRVKLRVFEKYEGKCYLSGRKITPADVWQCDHIIALINGGKNCESNLAPALKDKHKEKTKLDVAEKAKVSAKRLKHLGIKKTKKKIQSRGFKSYPSNTKQLRDNYTTKDGERK